MTWLTLALLSLAAFRVYRLIADDTILDRPRAWLLRIPRDWAAGRPVPRAYRPHLADFITCPWCLGFWVAVAWWGCWKLWPHATVLVAVPFAISTVVGAIAHALTDE